MTPIIQNGSIKISARGGPISEPCVTADSRWTKETTSRSIQDDWISWDYGGLELEGRSGQSHSGGYCQGWSCGGHMPHHMEKAAHNQREK